MLYKLYGKNNKKLSLVRVTLIVLLIIDIIILLLLILSLATAYVAALLFIDIELLSLLSVSTIYDVVKKNDNNKKYNILCIIGEGLIVFIFMRYFFDKGFLYNMYRDDQLDLIHQYYIFNNFYYY